MIPNVARPQDFAHTTPSGPATAVPGQAFSALKFTRSVRVNKDGSVSMISEEPHRLVARDADGRVLLAGGPHARNPCDLPDVGKLPLCEYWTVLIFDPVQGVTWAWAEGPTADRAGYVEVHLSSEQISRGERLTATKVVVPADDARSGIHVQDLGEKVIEGISARGSRVTTLQEERLGGEVTIDEVWTSAQMGVVVRAIHGDPNGIETISGLERISLTKSEVMFELPKTRRLFEWTDKSGLAEGDLVRMAEDDLAELATWLVH